MLRSSRICLVALVVVLGISVLSGNAYEYPYYHLTAWRFGAIAWIGGEPQGSDVFIDRLDQAVDRVLAFWEFEAIEPHPQWDEPQSVRGLDPGEKWLSVGVVNYEGGPPWRLPPPSWGGEIIWPLVIAVFPDEASLRSLTGDRNSAWFSFSGIGLPGSRPLLHGAPVMLVVSLTASQGTLAHEITHWLTYQDALYRGFWLNDLPPFLVEGMAELSERLFPDSNVRERLSGSEGEWGSTLLDLAAENCLSIDLPLPARYTLGESFVGYLVDELGAAGFFAELPRWAETPAELIELYEPGWRESLGLPAECGTDQGDSE